MLVGKTRDHNLRNAELVWLDDVEGMGWVMERMIELVRRSNSDQFDFDLREFAESPQVASYKSSEAGHFAWHSDIGLGAAAGKRKLTLVLQLNEPSTYDGGNLKIMPFALPVPGLKNVCQMIADLEPTATISRDKNGEQTLSFSAKE